MKKSIIITALLLVGAIAQAQTKVVKDASGNYVQLKRVDSSENKPTGHNFIDKEGKSYPMYISARGKLYYLRTSKAGNVYKAYVKED